MRLTDDPATDYSPRWSPDGERIAFVSERDGDQDIVVMAADGSGQIDVSDDPDVDDAPAWSPDGGSIAFVAYLHGADPFTIGQGDAEIFVVRADGSHKVDVSRNHAWDGDPAWSPDGRSIAFTRRTDHAQIFVMRANGNDQRRLRGVDGLRERLLPRVAPRARPPLAPAEVPDARDQLVRGPPLVHGLPPDEVGTRAEQHDHACRRARVPGLRPPSTRHPWAPPRTSAADGAVNPSRPRSRSRADSRRHAAYERGPPVIVARGSSGSAAGRSPTSTAHSERRISATSRGSVISS